MNRRMYIGVASTPAAATVDTAGEGGFFGFTVDIINAGSNTKISGGAEQNYVYQFVLYFRAVISKVSSEIRTAEVGKFYGLGIYDINKDLVARTAQIGMDATGIQETALVASATLEPGVYYYAQTTDGTTGELRGTILGTASMTIMNEGSENRVGRAANDGVAGVLPATMGDITATVNRSPAVAFFKP